MDDLRGRPRGTLRLNAGETGARVLLRQVVPTFLERHPEMALDLVTDGELVDIVAQGFDAGVRLGEALPQDMVAVPIGGPTRFVAVASPAYLMSHPPPKVPDDLRNHDCIRVRMPSGKLHRWEFEYRGRSIVVDVPGSLTLDHLGLMVEAAADGLGIAYVPDRDLWYQPAAPLEAVVRVAGREPERRTDFPKTVSWPPKERGYLL